MSESRTWPFQSTKISRTWFCTGFWYWCKLEYSKTLALLLFLTGSCMGGCWYITESKSRSWKYILCSTDYEIQGNYAQGKNVKNSLIITLLLYQCNEAMIFERYDLLERKVHLDSWLMQLHILNEIHRFMSLSFHCLLSKIFHYLYANGPIFIYLPGMRNTQVFQVSSVLKIKNWSFDI